MLVAPHGMLMCMMCVCVYVYTYMCVVFASDLVLASATKHESCMEARSRHTTAALQVESLVQLPC